MWWDGGVRCVGWRFGELRVLVTGKWVALHLICFVLFGFLSLLVDRYENSEGGC